MRLELFIILLCLTLTSCKGQRFYWESKFEVESSSPDQQSSLKKSFDLTGNLNSWHPVFGKYCSSLPSYRAHLFVCWKDNTVSVVSSYNGSLKGDEPIRTGASTIEKYLSEISGQAGYETHQKIKGQIYRLYRVKKSHERLMVYGRGSIILKNELSGDI